MQTDENVVETPLATLEASGTLIVDVVYPTTSAYLTDAITEAKKGKGRHVWSASQMRWAPKHCSQKKEKLLGWRPMSK